MVVLMFHLSGDDSWDRHIKGSWKHPQLRVTFPPILSPPKGGHLRLPVYLAPPGRSCWPAGVHGDWSHRAVHCSRLASTRYWNLNPTYCNLAHEDLAPVYVTMRKSWGAGGWVQRCLNGNASAMSRSHRAISVLGSFSYYHVARTGAGRGPRTPNVCCR